MKGPTGEEGLTPLNGEYLRSRSTLGYPQKARKKSSKARLLKIRGGSGPGKIQEVHALWGGFCRCLVPKDRSRISNGGVSGKKEAYFGRWWESTLGVGRVWGGGSAVGGGRGCDKTKTRGKGRKQT